jgi:hypothetical protein
MIEATPILSPTAPRVMSTDEYLDALKALYMPPYSRTSARELGVKVKEAEA